MVEMVGMAEMAEVAAEVAVEGSGRPSGFLETVAVGQEQQRAVCGPVGQSRPAES